MLSSKATIKEDIGRNGLCIEAEQFGQTILCWCKHRDPEWTPDFKITGYLLSFQKFVSDKLSQ